MELPEVLNRRAVLLEVRIHREADKLKPCAAVLRVPCAADELAEREAKALLPLLDFGSLRVIFHASPACDDQ